jgi:hypothetical protein
MSRKRVRSKRVASKRSGATSFSQSRHLITCPVPACGVSMQCRWLHSHLLGKAHTADELEMNLYMRRGLREWKSAAEGAGTSPVWDAQAPVHQMQPAAAPGTRMCT